MVVIDQCPDEHCMCGLPVPKFLDWNADDGLVPLLLVLGCGCDLT